MHVLSNTKSSSRGLSNISEMRVLRTLPCDPDEKYILFRLNGSIEIVPTDLICRCVSKGTYTTILFDDRDALDIWMGIGKLVKKLPPTRFIQTHQSHVVNINKIIRVATNTVVLDDGSSVPLSRRSRNRVESRILAHYKTSIIL